MRLWHWIGGVIVTLAIVAGDNELHVREAHAALRSAGYGEFVFKQSRHPYCPFGEVAFAFITNGRPPDGYEAEGYICAGYFGDTSVHETKLYPDEDIDWD